MGKKMKYRSDGGFIVEAVNSDKEISLEVRPERYCEAIYITKKDVIQMFKMFKNDCDHTVGFWDDGCDSFGLTKKSEYLQKDWKWQHTDILFKNCSDCGEELGEIDE
jgi:hypothetical protein